jgi:hypothetical protein
VSAMLAEFTKALSVCRGTLYSARTGHATQIEIEELLESTGQDSLISLIGSDALDHAMQLAESLPDEETNVLLSINK